MTDKTAQSHKLPLSAEQVEDEIRECLNQWIDAINHARPDAIDKLYDRDGILLATFDPEPRITSEGRKNYFIALKFRRNLKASVDDCVVTLLGEDGATANGYYTFRFVNEAGEPQSVRARYTFVYHRQPSGEWLIAAHHSSQSPPQP